MSSDKGNRLIKNTFIVGLGSIASKAIAFLMAPLFSHWLSVEEYGAFDLVTTYVSLLLPFCTLSIAEACFRFLLDDLESRKKKEVVSSSLTVALMGYVTFMLIYFLLSKCTGLVDFKWIICVLLFSQMLFTYFSEVARGIKEVGLYSLFSFISVVLLASFSTIFLVIFKLGLNGIVLGYSLAYLISAVGLFFTTKAYHFVSIYEVSIPAIKEMLAYSWPLIPNSISWWVVNVSDRLIINNFIGLAANGIYAVANKIPAIVNVLFSVFHVSWVQSASETVTDEDYSKYCNGVFNKLIPFIFSTVTGLISGNFLFYYFIFDAKYFEAYYYSPVLILAAGVSCIGQFMGGIMIAKKKTKQNGATNIIAAISNILINLAMVRKFGLYAASISTLLAYSILVLCRAFIIQKHVALKIQCRSWVTILITGVVFAGAFLNNMAVNTILLILSCAWFLYINRDLLLKSASIVLRR